MSVSSVPRRILAAWFPWWSAERLAWSLPEARARPFATVSGRHGPRAVEAVNRRAARLGLTPGMLLADAKAIAPETVVRPADPQGDGRVLERLARWANRFTPRVAPAGADALLLDIGGCAHLFGGEEELMASLGARLEALALTARLALADTPGAAWALARYGAKVPAIVPSRADPSEVREALAGLPVAALRLDAEVVEELVSFGLERIGTLYAFAPGALEERFGPAPVRRLGQALGLIEEPMTPLPPLPPREARRAFCEPVSTAAGVRAAVDGLLGELCGKLGRAGEGVRRLRLVCHQVGGERWTATVGTSRPVRRGKLLMGLFAEKLLRVEPGFGIEEMVLSADVVEVVGEAQEDLFAVAGENAGPGAGGEELAGLLDRLGNRFGFESVACPLPRQSWLPERAVRLREPLAAPRIAAPGWPEGRRRPLRLLSPPERVETPAADSGAAGSGGAPAFFRWRGRTRRLRMAEGPERLECEWWLEDAPSRDYYQAEDEEGRRYWLYRERSRASAAPRWFLHGLFA